MHIVDNTAYIVGGYSWENNQMMELFPVNEVTRVVFSDELKVESVDVVKLLVDSPTSFSPFVPGFS